MTLRDFPEIRDGRIRIAWDVPIELSGPLADLQQTVELGAGELVFPTTLSRGDVRRLRSVSPEDTWQMAMDDLALALGTVSVDHAGAYQSTLWGMLRGLRSGDDGHWQRFIRLYEQPIAGTIRRMSGGQISHAEAAEHAIEFFGWFARGRVCDGLEREADDARVRRFRGYLPLCIRTFLKEEVWRRPGAGNGLEMGIESVDAPWDDVLDEEFVRVRVAVELDSFRRHNGESHALLLGCLRVSGAELARQLGCSEATISRRRQRAMRDFRGYLLRALEGPGMSREEARAELVRLNPLVARALREHARDA